MLYNENFEQEIKEILSQLGILFHDKEIVYDKPSYPFITYSRKKDLYTLYFPGPADFGIQSFQFSLYDFCSAFYDSQNGHFKPKDERFSLMDYFLCENWFQNEKMARIGIVLFCFSLTPTGLKRFSKKYGKKLILVPKLYHLSKILSFSSFQQLNDFWKS